MGYERQGKIAIQGGERDTLPQDRDLEAGTGAAKNDDEDEDDDLPSAETALAHRLPGQKKAKKNHDHSHSHGSSGGGGHSHGGHSHDGSMNMRGVFLHVLGDALGNVGVILAGVFIASTTYWWRYYSDPLISFVITIIIFHSALPLVKSASFILLQGVPSGVPLEQVKEAMHRVDGVLSVHELHIWQLSESKIVASVHVLVDCSTGQEQKYMGIAADLRRLMHAYGIHSSTIQPEFVAGGIVEAARISGVEVATVGDGSSGDAAAQQTGADGHKRDAEGRLIAVDGSLVEHALSRVPSSCLLACDEECEEEPCCPPEEPVQKAKSNVGSDDGHGHGHGHGHSH